MAMTRKGKVHKIDGRGMPAQHTFIAGLFEITA